MRSFGFLFLLFSIFHWPNMLRAQQISVEEKSLCEAISKRNKAALDLLKESVSINSGTMNFKGVKRVGELFQKELNKLNFETHWMEGSAFHRAGHLIAMHKGKSKRKILLIGHLDTVFEENSPFQNFSQVNDSIVKGPGVADMKGGNVIMLLALQALYDAKILNDLNIEIVLSGEEESSGYPLNLAKKDLIEAAKWADYALGFEDGDGLSTTAVVARRGSCEWTLTVKGKAAHSSQIFTEQEGDGAVYEASRILNEFYNQLKSEENLTISPGIILGGNQVHYDSLKKEGSAYGKSNIVAQDCFVKGDLRCISTSQLARAKAIMHAIVSKNLSKTTAILDFGDEGYPPMTFTEGNKKLLELYSQVSLDLGYGPETAVNPRDAGAADICFANDWVEMALDGLGLTGGNGHTTNEFANINYLPIEAKRTALLIYRLSNLTP